MRDQIVRYLQTAERPGQLWSMSGRSWVATNDAAFVEWQKLPGASVFSFPTIRELSEFAYQIGGVPPTVARKAVDAKARERLSAGYADAVTGKTFQCDDESIAKWTALAANAGLALVMGISPAPSFQIIAADNSVVTLSATDTFALFAQRVMPWVSATILHGRSVKDDILADSPPQDVDTGWPT